MINDEYFPSSSCLTNRIHDLYFYFDLHTISQMSSKCCISPLPRYIFLSFPLCKYCFNKFYSSVW